MRLGKGLVMAVFCAAPMIASAAALVPRDTFQDRSDMLVISGQVDPVSVPEPGTLALMLAGLGGIAATRRRPRDNDDR
jgi:PEP-CTERM motif